MICGGRGLLRQALWHGFAIQKAFWDTGHQRFSFVLKKYYKKALDGAAKMKNHSEAKINNNVNNAFSS